MMMCEKAVRIAFCFIALSLGAAVSQTVTVDTSDPTVTLNTRPSLQVVAHSLLMRDSPIYARSMELLKGLEAEYVRYVPWLPTPRLSVAALNPPSGKALCPALFASTVPEDQVASVSCAGDGGGIHAVSFASFGAPTGHCGHFVEDESCKTPDAVNILTEMCFGETTCSVRASREVFGVPGPACGDKPLSLALEVQCANASVSHTYWNFDLLDEQFLDVWDAIGGEYRPSIPNFSTSPTWLYSNDTWDFNYDCNWQNNCTFGGYSTPGVAPASAHGGVEALGDYYGRLLAWYTKGGFHDEYGKWIESNHFLNITIWEIFNEVDYEHGYDVESYTEAFDAIVRSIRKFADEEKKIKFVGLSLPNIDDQNKVVEWATYFLNASNHAEDVRDAVNYIGYHSYPTADFKPFNTPSSYRKFFDYADVFVEKVAAVEQVRRSLSPSTKVMLDESGTDDGIVSLDDPTYFVASASHFAYLFLRCSQFNDSVVVVGQSQFMDSPDREPSVTMMDWRSGEGTPKYWMTKLLIDSFRNGDVFVNTIVSGSGTANVYAQAYRHNTDGNSDKTVGDTGREGHSQLKLALINKTEAEVTVSLPEEFQGCKGLVVDGTSNQESPRTIQCSVSDIILQPYATAIVEAHPSTWSESVHLSLFLK